MSNAGKGSSMWELEDAYVNNSCETKIFKNYLQHRMVGKIELKEKRNNNEIEIMSFFTFFHEVQE